MLWSIHHISIVEPVPVQPIEDIPIAASWMRINYAGEICAQGLLLGAMCSAYDDENAQHFGHIMEQELQHVHWCKKRLVALGADFPRYAFLWSSVCFVLAFCNGMRGDNTSWALIEETEVLVMRHLRESYQALSVIDPVSADVVRAILHDEMTHAHTAHHAVNKKTRTGLLPLMRPMFHIMKKAEA